MTLNVYRNESGSLYKAANARQLSDSMLVSPSQMLLDLLTSTPMTQAMVDEQLIKGTNCLDTLNSMGIDPESEEAKPIIAAEMGLDNQSSMSI